MPMYFAAAIVCFLVVFADILCDSAANYENNSARNFCNCINVTTEYGLSIKCNCISHELKDIPSDLPSPLHGL